MQADCPYCDEVLDLDGDDYHCAACGRSWSFDDLFSHRYKSFEDGRLAGFSVELLEHD